MDNIKDVLSKDLRYLKTFDEFHWFNNEVDYPSNDQNNIDLSIPHRHKTKIIASIGKCYSYENLEKLVKEGIKIFRLNGQTLNYKDYRTIIHNINHIFSQIGEIPTIIFNLKGSIPVITKIGGKKESKTLEKGEQINIVYHSRDYDHEDIIYIDKKIFNHVKPGDKISIGGSDVILQVKKIDCVKRNFSRTQLTQFRSVPFLNKRSFENGLRDEYRDLYGEKDEYNLHEEYRLEELKEECEIEYNAMFPSNENEEFSFEAANFDNYIEDKVRNKQEKITQAYLNIVHKQRSETINHMCNMTETNTNTKSVIDLDRISNISHINCSSNCHFNFSHLRHRSPLYHN